MALSIPRLRALARQPAVAGPLRDFLLALADDIEAGRLDRKPVWFDRLPDRDGDGIDPFSGEEGEAPGVPGRTLVGNALQLWVMLQQRERVTVAEAADAFNLTDALVREAIEGSAWCDLDGDAIVLDGH